MGSRSGSKIRIQFLYFHVGLGIEKGSMLNFLSYCSGLCRDFQTEVVVRGPSFVMGRTWRPKSRLSQECIKPERLDSSLGCMCLNEYMCV